MPKYLARASYTPAGLQGLLKEGGTSREAAVRAAVESLGGTLDGLYWGFGESDVFVLTDFPDNESAAAFALNVGSQGAVTDISTTSLMTAAEVDAATAKTADYRAPGS